MSRCSVPTSFRNNASSSAPPICTYSGSIARPHRIQVPGGTYHVTSRGNRLQSIFHDDFDRRIFLALRDRVIGRCEWQLHAYCLMTNHFHLLIKTPNPNLSAGMQRLKSDYATYFNGRYSFEGHLFQQRFGSRLIETEEHFADTLRYIAFNPVKAGLCAHPADWPWSSFYGAREFVFDR
jgi:REP-associated tyrosine transposase